MVSVRGSTPTHLVRDFERQIRDLGNTRIPRAIQYALNGVAMDAVKLTVPMLRESLDNPTPWIEKAFVARRGDLKVTDKNDAEASLVVKPDQSTVFKYMLGEDERTPIKRQAGDVGPAENKTLVPIWPGIEMHSKVKKNAKGNLPRTALARLFEGKGTPNGVFWGTPVVMGTQRDLALWSRPKRIWDSNQQQMVNQGFPTMLLAAMEETEHAPVLTAPTKKLAEKAMQGLQGKLEDALRSELGRSGGDASARSRGVSRP